MTTKPGKIVDFVITSYFAVTVRAEFGHMWEPRASGCLHRRSTLKIFHNTLGESRTLKFYDSTLSSRENCGFSSGVTPSVYLFMQLLLENPGLHWHESEVLGRNFVTCVISWMM